MKRLLALLTLSTAVFANDCDPTYPSDYYEGMAGSYDQLAAAYAQLAVDAQNCCGRIFVGSEYLYWHPCNDNLDYAIDGVATANEGQLYQIEPSWTSGYRVFAGYEFPCSRWIFDLTFTRFNSNDSNSTTPSTGLTLYSTRGNPSTGLFEDLDFGSGDWNLHYHALLANLSYVFRVRCGLNLIPSIGLQYDWIRDELDITYIDGSTTAFIDVNQTISAIGPRIGIGSTWTFYRNFSLFANAAFKGLWLKNRTHYIQDVVGSTSNDVNTRAEELGGRIAFDFIAGLMWNCHLTQRIEIFAKAGWESLTWIDYSGAWEFVDSDRNGSIARSHADLDLQGLTVSLGLLF